MTGFEDCKLCLGSGDCPQCNGHGQQDGLVCDLCGGSGMCPECGGSGLESPDEEEPLRT